jgi:hypothetical protein
VQLGDKPMIFMDPTVSSAPAWADPPATPNQVVSQFGLNYLYDTDLTYAAPKRTPKARPRPAKVAKVASRKK